MLTVLETALAAHCKYLLSVSGMNIVDVGDWSYSTHDSDWGSLAGTKTKMVFVHVSRLVGGVYLPGWETIAYSDMIYDREINVIREYVVARGKRVSFRGEYMLYLHEYNHDIKLKIGR